MNEDQIEALKKLTAGIRRDISSMSEEERIDLLADMVVLQKLMTQFDRRQQKMNIIFLALIMLGWAFVLLNWAAHF